MSESSESGCSTGSEQPESVDDRCSARVSGSWRGRYLEAAERNKLQASLDGEGHTKNGQLVKQKDLSWVYNYLGSFAIDQDLQYQPVKSASDLPPLLHGDYIENLSEAQPDLSEGFCRRSVIRNYDDYWEKKADYFFRWQLEECPWRVTPHFVGNNGAFSDLLRTPYRSNAWKVLATRFNGVVYLKIMDLNDLQGQNQQRNRMTVSVYAGEKFKRLVQGVDTVNAHQKDFAVHETVFGNKKLLVLTEVHSCKDWGKGKNPQFVDIKQVGVDLPADQYYDRCLYWWSRAKLSGMKEIVIGRRTRHNILESIEVTATDDLPKACSGEWTPESGYKFFEYVLNYIGRVTVKDDPNLVYVISKRPGFNTEVVLEDTMDAEDAEVIPTWFVQRRKKHGKEPKNGNHANGKPNGSKLMRFISSIREGSWRS